MRVAGRRAAEWVAAAFGYALVACAVKWPLPANFQTHLLGEPTGDTGVYVWNFWIFRHELIRHWHLPFSTDHIFAFTGGSDFSVHNFAPVAGALGVPLIGTLGVVGAFNVVHLALVTLSGTATFLLARCAGLRTGLAWAVGLVFVASPTLVTRDSAHFSLTITAALPIFLCVLVRTLDSRRVRDAVLLGLTVAVAAYSDAYFGIFCVLMGAFVVGWRFVLIGSGASEDRRNHPTGPLILRAVDAVLVIVGILIVWRWLAGPIEISAGPLPLRLRSLYTPTLVLTCGLIWRAWYAYRPILRWRQPVADWPRLVRLALISIGFCLLLLLPVILGITARLASGRMPTTTTTWRSTPRGVDLLAYFVPNQNHAWFGERTHDWLLPPGADAFPEYVASFSIVALIVIAAGLWLRALPRSWIGFTAIFAALSLGPFVHIAGVNTYVIGPWALLRYVPVIGMVRTPSRFAIVAVLGLAVLFGFALDAVLRKAGQWREAVAVLIVAAIAFELAPLPRRLHSAAVPDVYRTIAAAGEESGRLLELPTGVRDGTSSIGNFNPATQYFQTAHRRAVIGGYLSRVSGWRKRRNRRNPMLRALFVLSEGEPLSESVRQRAYESRDAFLRASCVTFVLVHRQWAPDGLEQFAVDALRLRRVSADDDYALYQPVDQPACERPPRPVRR